MSKRELERLVARLARIEGVSVRVTTKGWVLYLPDGTTAGLHRTPSDRRAMKNFRARIQRSGIEWPG